MNDSKAFEDKFFEIMQHHKDLLAEVAHGHPDFDTLYASAEETLTGKDFERVEKHLSICTQCQAVVADLRQLIQGGIDESAATLSASDLPEKIRKAIPKPARPRGAFVELVFNSDGVIDRVRGIVRSMGGMLENLKEFTVERLAPDTDYLADVRTHQPSGPDFRTSYRDFEIIFSPLPQMRHLEVYVTVKGQPQKGLAAVKFRLQDKAGNSYAPESRIAGKDSLKLVFTDLDLPDGLYEFQIESEPVAD